MTQEDMVMDFIERKGSISSWEAIMELGITRLAAKIWKLNRKGYIFNRADVTKKNRYGKKVTYTVYSLVKGEDLT